MCRFLSLKLTGVNSPSFLQQLVSIMFAMLFYAGKCYCADIGNINFS
ncbi:hypothetical protein SPWS13_2645 [Shewanella putrefaciens]|nr:hypothetical protein SPWS13_2645 [Shewanella putrefaciens]